MALNAIPYSSSVQITYHMGIDEDGKNKMVTRSLTGLKTDESDENVYDVVNLIIGLQQPPVTALYRINRTMFTED